MEYKKNHFVPKSIINNWSVRGEKYVGVHCHLIDQKKDIFSSSSGSSPFSFAIENDLYVPKLESSRRVEAEKWLSGIEGALASFTRQALSGNDIQFKSLQEATLVAMALLVFEVRSSYVMGKFAEELQKNEELAKKFSVGENERTSHQAIAENLPNFAHETLLKLQPIQFVFFRPKNSAFILCDRPLLDPQILNEPVIILAPKLAVSIRTGSPPYSFKYVDAEDSLVEELNTHFALQARDWIVAISSEQLSKYIAVANSDEWHKKKSGEKVSFEGFKFLTNGWEFKPGDTSTNSQPQAHTSKNNDKKESD